MSGEPAPRFIIPSKTQLKSSGKVSLLILCVLHIKMSTACECNGQRAVEKPAEVD